jgi:2-hydroxychromene-2-carboxylate isomerase
MWEDNKNLNDLDILKATLNENNMDVEAIFDIVNSQECKDKLIANTSAAVERGAFGVPTFFLDDQIFFGKDHLYQLEEYINSNQK